jgi:hypothetical protein
MIPHQHFAYVANMTSMPSLSSFTMKDMSKVRLWEDKWLGNLLLREQYPCLYNITRHKQTTIAKVFSTSKHFVET